MYDQFYQLSARPFQLTPDPRFYFESGTHRKALSYLGYGLAQGEGFIVITGDVGAGKSTLVAHLMDTVDPARMTAVKLVSTQVGGDDMLRLAAQQFGIETAGMAKADILHRIEQWLMDNARAGKRSLLIVDEAQCLDVSALEELRMLSNFQLGGQALLQIFLLGQPEFRDLLQGSPALEQLRQRVIATHHLEPMQTDEIGPYIEHRLFKSGWNGDPQFTDAAYAAMYDFSEGIPRKLNVLASRVLLFGAMEQLHQIDGHDVMDVIRDMTGEIDLADEVVSDAPVPITPTPLAPAPVTAAPVAEIPRVEAPASAPAMPAREAAPSDWDAPLELEAIAEEVVDTSSAYDNYVVPDYVPPAFDVSPQEAVASHFDHLENDSVFADTDVAILQERIAQLEARIDTQDAALRRVLNMLIGWAESDGHVARHNREPIPKGHSRAA
jgi:general secretion pathway protein A